MKVSVDGLRRSLARAYGKAITGYQELARENEGCRFDTLKEGLDDMRQMIAAFMCMYSDDPADLMSNMTEEALKLPFADPTEEE